MKAPVLKNFVGMKWLVGMLCRYIRASSMCCIVRSTKVRLIFSSAPSVVYGSEAAESPGSQLLQCWTDRCDV